MLIEKQLIRRSLSDTISEHFSLDERIIARPTRLHIHSYYEMEIVLDGEGEQNLNGTVYPLKKGTFYFLTPIDFHSVSPKGELKILNVSFRESAISPELSLSLINRRSDFLFQSDSPIGSKAEKLMSLIRDEMSSPYSLSDRCIGNLIDLIVCSILKEAEPTGASYSSFSAQGAIKYLFQNFRNQISLELLASQSGYTPSYLSKLFKRMTGKTFLDFLFDLRLNYAKTLLLTTDKSVSEVSEKSGFGSVSHFHRRFHDRFGLSPASFRKASLKTKNQIKSDNSEVAK